MKILRKSRPGAPGLRQGLLLSGLLGWCRHRKLGTYASSFFEYRQVIVHKLLRVSNHFLWVMQPEIHGIYEICRKL